MKSNLAALLILLVAAELNAQITTSEIKVEQTGGVTNIGGELTSGNIKVYAQGAAWAEGMLVIRPTSWAGIRLARFDPSTNNFNGNWALGYNANTGNDFSISTNYNDVQYDGLFHISNSSRNVGIGTVSPSSKFEVSGDIKIHSGTNGTSSKLIFKTADNSDLSKFIGLESYWTVIGAHGNEGWRFKDDSGDILMQINGLGSNNGYVGIGTTSPESTLHSNGLLTINTNGSSYNEGIRIHPSSFNGYSQISLNAVSGTSGTGTGQWTIYTGPGVSNAFGLTYAGNNDFLRVSTAGNVGIGTLNPDPNYKLEVNGTVRATTFSAVSPPSWPDFVFEKDYNLRSLEELEQHINVNGHLPEIPSEAEVTENGINLGEMNAKLLQKIEELTLYLIEQNKEIQELKKEVSALKNE